MSREGFVLVPRELKVSTADLLKTAVAYHVDVEKLWDLILDSVAQVPKITTVEEFEAQLSLLGERLGFENNEDFEKKVRRFFKEQDFFYHELAFEFAYDMTPGNSKSKRVDMVVKFYPESKPFNSCLCLDVT